MGIFSWDTLGLTTTPTSSGAGSSWADVLPEAFQDHPVKIAPTISHLTELDFLKTFTTLCSYLVLHVCLLAFRLHSDESKGLSHLVSNTVITGVQHLLYKLFQRKAGCSRWPVWLGTQASLLVYQQSSAALLYIKDIGEKLQVSFSFLILGKLWRNLLILRFIHSSHFRQLSLKKNEHFLLMSPIFVKVQRNKD